jgi:hypothetical protein
LLKSWDDKTLRRHEKSTARQSHDGSLKTANVIDWTKINHVEITVLTILDYFLSLGHLLAIGN